METASDKFRCTATSVLERHAFANAKITKSILWIFAWRPISPSLLVERCADQCRKFTANFSGSNCGF